MNTALTHSLTPDNCSDLPPLPKRILSRDQTMIETDHSIWQLSNPSKPGRHRNINWGQLDDKNIRQPLSRRARHLLKLYLADRLSKKEALTVRDNYDSFLSFTRWLLVHVSDFPTLSDPEAFNWSDITEGLARAFLEWNMKHRARKGIDFTCLRAFYAWGIARGYPDFQQSPIEIKQSLVTPTEAIKALVAASREKFIYAFSGEHQDFEAMKWCVKELIDRPATQQHAFIYFTRYRTRDQALPSIYAEVVKSWIVLEKHSLGNMLHRSHAVRFLWEAILLRRGNDSSTFCWQNFCEEDLSQTELLMHKKHLSASTVYKLGIELLSMANFLAARSVCRQLYYTLLTPRQEDFNKST